MMIIEPFFHPATNTFTYLVVDEQTRQCALIDPVLDFSPVTGEVKTNSIDAIMAIIKKNDWCLDWIIETHIHADHLSASAYLKKEIGVKIAISAAVLSVLEHWVYEFNTEHNTHLDGTQFDSLFKHQDTFMLGSLQLKVLQTPGHTPCGASFLVEDACFVGDTLFSPQLGTARCDFHDGSARALYQSIHLLFKLPDNTRLYIGHDYPKEGQKPIPYTTVLDQKEKNIMINQTVSEEAFVQKRQARDKQLAIPKLMYYALQVNLRAGYLGAKEENGKVYLKLPLICN